MESRFAAFSQMPLQPQALEPGPEAGYLLHLSFHHISVGEVRTQRGCMERRSGRMQKPSQLSPTPEAVDCLLLTPLGGSF